MHATNAFIKFIAVVGGLYVFIFGSAFAYTEFNCTINAVDTKDVAVLVGETGCSATVIYVNTDTGEQQTLFRNCRIEPYATSCRANYDDSDVIIDYPRIAGVARYSHAAKLRKFEDKGCIQKMGDISTNEDTTAYHAIYLVQNMVCAR